jgi:peptidoglycan/LPS O-acetylase OafA/YrhL
LNELDPGGWGMLNYIWFFLAGFLIIANDRLRNSMLRRRWYHLGLAIFFGVILLYMTLTNGTSAYQSVFESIDDLIRAMCSFSLILASLGLGLWKLNFTSPALKYANEAVLPFYILHQTVLVVVGFFVVGWNLPDLLKYILIIGISFPVILMTYELLIRRSNLLRVLFGMKSLPAKQATKQVEAGAQAD